MFFFFFSSRRRHTRWPRDWSSDVCSSDLDWLAGLPATLAPRADVLMCHGTPRSDTEPMLETVELDGPRPASHAEIAVRAAGSHARLIACGHTHVPRLMRTADGCAIVNPGSVGLQAYDDPHPLAPLEEP